MSKIQFDEILDDYQTPEDFVEMIARIAVFGPEWYEKKVARAKELYLNATSALDFAYDPSEALRQKETIVVSYLKDIWGINFYDQDGEKGLVITENEDNIFEPTVLDFRNNNLYDLSDPSVKQTIEIADVMKTMDNRIKLDKSLLEEYQAN